MPPLVNDAARLPAALQRRWPCAQPRESISLHALEPERHGRPSRRGSSSWQVATPLPASRNLKTPASIRRRRPLAMMPASRAPRDAIHMASKAGLADELALRRADCGCHPGCVITYSRSIVSLSTRQRFAMSSIFAVSAPSAGAPFARTTIERRKLRDNDVPGQPATRKIATCWSCERPIALKPECSSYHCESCDVRGSDEPALVRSKMTEQTYYFVGRDGLTRLEHYVEHSDSSLSSPA